MYKDLSMNHFGGSIDFESLNKTSRLQMNARLLVRKSLNFKGFLTPFNMNSNHIFSIVYR